MLSELVSQLESSTAQCYNCLQELVSAPPKGKQKQNPYQSDPKVQAVLQELDKQKNRPGGFLTHPKMEKLKMLLIEHFAQKRFEKEDADLVGGREGVTGDSHVMVFCSFRQCVDEVVKFLNLDSPMIRAVPFIGQGTDKSGKKGYGQKEQLDVRSPLYPSCPRSLITFAMLGDQTVQGRRLQRARVNLHWRRRFGHW